MKMVLLCFSYSGCLRLCLGGPINDILFDTIFTSFKWSCNCPEKKIELQFLLLYVKSCPMQKDEHFKCMSSILVSEISYVAFLRIYTYLQLYLTLFINFFFSVLYSIPGRYESFWKELDYVKHLWKNRQELKVEDAGIAALFGLECFAWFCAGEIVGRGFTFTGYYV